MRTLCRVKISAFHQIISSYLRLSWYLVSFLSGKNGVFWIRTYRTALPKAVSRAREIHVLECSILQLYYSSNYHHPSPTPTGWLSTRPQVNSSQVNSLELVRVRLDLELGLGQGLELGFVLGLTFSMVGARVRLGLIKNKAGDHPRPTRENGPYPNFNFFSS